MRTWLIFIFIITCAIHALGQQKGKPNRWHVTAAASLMNGNTKTGSAVIGTIGFDWKAKWTLGLGSGIDHYFFRSVPVFAEFQRFIGKEYKGLFVYGSAGLNVPWPTDDQRAYRQNWGWGGAAQESAFSKGFCTDLGIGYGFKGKKGHGMFLRAGHSIKTMEQRYTEQVWNGSSTVPALREISYLFGRISIQAGIRF